MTDEDQGLSGPLCAGCSERAAAVFMNDGRALCARCALVEITPLVASTIPAVRPTVVSLLNVQQPPYPPDLEEASPI
jgi:hypothetical protein